MIALQSVLIDSSEVQHAKLVANLSTPSSTERLEPRAPAMFDVLR